MSLSYALQNLRLPSLEHTINSGEDPVHPHLEEWKASALDTLTKVQKLLEQNGATPLGSADVAGVVAIAIPLSDDNLTTEPIRTIANSNLFFFATSLAMHLFIVLQKLLSSYLVRR